MKMDLSEREKQSSSKMAVLLRDESRSIDIFRVNRPRFVVGSPYRGALQRS